MTHGMVSAPQPEAVEANLGLEEWQNAVDAALPAQWCRPSSIRRCVESLDSGPCISIWRPRRASLARFPWPRAVSGNPGYVGGPHRTWPRMGLASSSKARLMRWVMVRSPRPGLRAYDDALKRFEHEPRDASGAGDRLCGKRVHGAPRELFLGGQRGHRPHPRSRSLSARKAAARFSRMMAPCAALGKFCATPIWRTRCDASPRTGSTISTGAIADEVVRDMQANGDLISLDDLKAAMPATTNHGGKLRGYRIAVPPPPTGRVMVLKCSTSWRGTAWSPGNPPTTSPCPKP